MLQAQNMHALKKLDCKELLKEIQMTSNWNYCDL